MSTLKLLFSKITDDAPVYEKKDVVEKIFVFRMLLIWHLLYTFVFILNCLDVFIVDEAIFATGYLLSCILLIGFIIALLIFGVDHVCAKYLCISECPCRSGGGGAVPFRLACGGGLFRCRRSRCTIRLQAHRGYNCCDA